MQKYRLKISLKYDRHIIAPALRMAVRSPGTSQKPPPQNYSTTILERGKSTKATTSITPVDKTAQKHKISVKINQKIDIKQQED